jgi:hypothetical protein
VIWNAAPQLADSTERTKISEISGPDTSIRDPKELWDELYELHLKVLRRLKVKVE